MIISNVGKAVQSYQNGDHYMIWCPGCKHRHYIPVRNQEVHKIQWAFNFNTERPTFSPSIKYSIPNGHVTCHFFITDGSIAFQSDCEHEFAAQTIPLLDFKEWPGRS